jgi:tetratricopeptide (TPR) repeat protein
MEAAMTHDRHGNPASGDRDATARYDEAVDAMLRFSPRVLELASVLVEQHADAPMSHAFMAYLSLSSTDLSDVPGARDAWAAMSTLAMNDRERAHNDAIAKWASGDWTGAARTLDDLLTHWPADLLALQFGHQLDFFLGDAGGLRDRPGRTLPVLDPEDPHTAFVRGMQGFGLEESGDYGAAEVAGRAAVAVNPDDVWAIHAVVHVCEMQGRVDDGIRFLRERRDNWEAGNLFTVHNWWHLALYLLEAGEYDEVLKIYDAEVHNAQSDGVSIEMLDASALLWRLFLDAHDTGDRFLALADAWTSRAKGDSWYVFNDLHAIMALAGAGRIDDAERRIRDIADYVQRDGSGTNVAMAAEIGLPASRAIVRFVQGRYEEVVSELAPIRRMLQHFGGSHAQRDALHRTLLEAALRAGNYDLARALTAERLSLRDTSVYGLTQWARIARATGNNDRACDADASAAVNRAHFASAWSSALAP